MAEDGPDPLVEWPQYDFSDWEFGFAPDLRAWLVANLRSAFEWFGRGRWRFGDGDTRQGMLYWLPPDSDEPPVYVTMDPGSLRDALVFEFDCVEGDGEEEDRCLRQMRAWRDAVEAAIAEAETRRRR